LSSLILDGPGSSGNAGRQSEADNPGRRRGRGRAGRWCSTPARRGGAHSKHKTSFDSTQQAAIACAAQPAAPLSPTPQAPPLRVGLWGVLVPPTSALVMIRVGGAAPHTPHPTGPPPPHPRPPALINHRACRGAAPHR